MLDVRQTFPTAVTTLKSTPDLARLLPPSDTKRRMPLRREAN